MITIGGFIDGSAYYGLKPFLVDSLFGTVMVTLLFVGCIGFYAMLGVYLVGWLSMKQVKYYLLGPCYALTFGMAYMVFSGL